LWNGSQNDAQSTDNHEQQSTCGELVLLGQYSLQEFQHTNCFLTGTWPEPQTKAAIGAFPNRTHNELRAHEVALKHLLLFEMNTPKGIALFHFNDLGEVRN
jgi:hypothetical protein